MGDHIVNFAEKVDFKYNHIILNKNRTDFFVNDVRWGTL